MGRPTHQNHMATNKGRKVVLILRTGERIEDRFVECGCGWIRLERTGRYLKSQCRCLLTGAMRHNLRKGG